MRIDHLLWETTLPQRFSVVLGGNGGDLLPTILARHSSEPASIVQVAEKALTYPFDIELSRRDPLSYWIPECVD